MRKFLQKYRLSLDLLTATNIIVGLLLIINPEFSTRCIFYIIGISALIWGANGIYRHFRVIRYGYRSKFDLIQAISGIIICFIFIFGYTLLTAVLPVLIGFIIIMLSISKIKLALYQKRSGARKWHLGLVLNTVSSLLGIALFFNPFVTMLSVLRLAGIILLINGISRLFTDFLFAHEMDKIDKGINIIDVGFENSKNENEIIIKE